MPAVLTRRKASLHDSSSLKAPSSPPDNGGPYTGNPLRASLSTPSIPSTSGASVHRSSSTFAMLRSKFGSASSSSSGGKGKKLSIRVLPTTGGEGIPGAPSFSPVGLAKSFPGASRTSPAVEAVAEFGQRTSLDVAGPEHRPSVDSVLSASTSSYGGARLVSSIPENEPPISFGSPLAQSTSSPPPSASFARTTFSPSPSGPAHRISADFARPSDGPSLSQLRQGAQSPRLSGLGARHARSKSNGSLSGTPTRELEVPPSPSRPEGFAGAGVSPPRRSLPATPLSESSVAPTPQQQQQAASRSNSLSVQTADPALKDDLAYRRLSISPTLGSARRLSAGLAASPSPMNTPGPEVMDTPGIPHDPSPDGTTEPSPALRSHSIASTPAAYVVGGAAEDEQPLSPKSDGADSPFMDRTLHSRPLRGKGSNLSAFSSEHGAMASPQPDPLAIAHFNEIPSPVRAGFPANVQDALLAREKKQQARESGYSVQSVPSTTIEGSPGLDGPSARRRQLTGGSTSSGYELALNEADIERGMEQQREEEDVAYRTADEQMSGRSSAGSVTGRDRSRRRQSGETEDTFGAEKRLSMRDSASINEPREGSSSRSSRDLSTPSRPTELKRTRSALDSIRALSRSASTQSPAESRNGSPTVGLKVGEALGSQPASPVYVKMPERGGAGRAERSRSLEAGGSRVVGLGIEDDDSDEPAPAPATTEVEEGSKASTSKPPPKRVLRKKKSQSENLEGRRAEINSLLAAGAKTAAPRVVSSDYLAPVKAVSPSLGSSAAHDSSAPAESDEERTVMNRSVVGSPLDDLIHGLGGRRPSTESGHDATSSPRVRSHLFPGRDVHDSRYSTTSTANDHAIAEEEDEVEAFPEPPVRAAQQRDSTATKGNEADVEDSSEDDDKIFYQDSPVGQHIPTVEVSTPQLTVDELERRQARLDAEAILTGAKKLPTTYDPDDPAAPTLFSLMAAQKHGAGLKSTFDSSSSSLISPRASDASAGNFLREDSQSPRNTDSLKLNGVGTQRARSYPSPDLPVGSLDRKFDFDSSPTAGTLEAPKTPRRWSLVEVERAYERMKKLLGSSKSVALESNAGGSEMGDVSMGDVDTLLEQANRDFGDVEYLGGVTDDDAMSLMSRGGNSAQSTPVAHRVERFSNGLQATPSPLLSGDGDTPVMANTAAFPMPEARSELAESLANNESQASLGDFDSPPAASASSFPTSVHPSETARQIDEALKADVVVTEETVPPLPQVPAAADVFTSGTTMIKSKSTGSSSVGQRPHGRLSESVMSASETEEDGWQTPFSSPRSQKRSESIDVSGSRDQDTGGEHDWMSQGKSDWLAGSKTDGAGGYSPVPSSSSTAERYGASPRLDAPTPRDAWFHRASIAPPENGSTSLSELLSSPELGSGRMVTHGSFDIQKVKSMDKLAIFFEYTAVKADLDKVEVERAALLDALQESRETVQDLRAQRDGLDSDLKRERASSRTFRKVLGDSGQAEDRMAELLESRRTWERRAREMAVELEMSRDELDSMRRALVESREREEQLERENVVMGARMAAASASAASSSPKDSLAGASPALLASGQSSPAISAGARTPQLDGEAGSLRGSPVPSSTRSPGSSPVISQSRLPARGGIPRARLASTSSSTGLPVPSKSAARQRTPSAASTLSLAGATSDQGSPIMAQKLSFASTAASPIKPAMAASAAAKAKTGLPVRSGLPKALSPALQQRAFGFGGPRHVSNASTATTASSIDFSDAIPPSKEDQTWTTALSGSSGDVPQLDEKHERYLSTLEEDSAK